MQIWSSALFVLMFAAASPQDTAAMRADPALRVVGFAMVILAVPVGAIGFLMFVYRNAGTATTHSLPGVFEQTVTIEHTGRWWLFIHTAPFASWNFACSLFDPVTGAVARHKRYSLFHRIVAHHRVPAGYFDVETPGDYLFRARGLQSARSPVEFFLEHQGEHQGEWWILLASLSVAALAGGLFLAF